VSSFAPAPCIQTQTVTSGVWSHPADVSLYGCDKFQGITRARTNRCHPAWREPWDRTISRRIREAGRDNITQKKCGQIWTKYSLSIADARGRTPNSDQWLYFEYPMTEGSVALIQTPFTSPTPLCTRTHIVWLRERLNNSARWSICVGGWLCAADRRHAPGITVCFVVDGCLKSNRRSSSCG